MAPIAASLQVLYDIKKMTLNLVLSYTAISGIALDPVLSK